METKFELLQKALVKMLTYTPIKLTDELHERLVEDFGEDIERQMIIHSIECDGKISLYSEAHSTIYDVEIYEIIF